MHYLVEHKGYPTALLANEMALQCGSKRLRADTVVYDNALKPRAIIEYKAPSVKITQEVFNQITAYNTLLRVDYLMVSNGLTHYCCKLDKARNSYQFLTDIPPYASL